MPGNDTKELEAAARGLTVTRWSRWHDDIEHAVRALPETPTCPHDLYLALLERTVATGGAVAVVQRGSGAVAVAGLRRAGLRRWENVTNWLVPGFVCAAAEVDVLPALARLGRTVSVAWWRMPGEPCHPAVRERVDTPVHRLEVADREAFWRSSGQWRHLVNARNRCRDLTLRFDEPGDAEWVIRSWAGRWSGSGPAEPGAEYAVEDRIAVAGHLGRQHPTIVLLDGDRRLAGTTQIVHGDTLVAGVLYRDDSVGALPTGIRLIDAVFDLAAERGLTTVDLGGGHAYKTRLAPAAGARSEFLVAPALEFRVRQAARVGRSAARAGIARLRPER